MASSAVRILPTIGLIHSLHGGKRLSSYISTVPTTRDAKLDEVVEGYKFYANLSVLWEEIAKNAPVKLSLSGNDLRSAKKCNEAIKMLGRAIDAHSYVDAYISGVPLEDILA